MADVNKTHWKKLVNTTWLGAWDFEEGQDAVLTIKEVKQEEVQNPTGKSEQCPVIYFDEGCKPFVGNKTNLKQIEKLAQSPYVENWIGLKIQIGVSEVTAFGQTVPALRVRSKKIEQKDVLK